MFDEPQDAPPRTPTHKWLEAKIRELSVQGIGIYVTHKGERMSGLVLLKLVGSPQECKLLTQQRNFETSQLEWINVFQEDLCEEKQADDYISRSIQRDPDLWVVEVEDKGMSNPFEDY